MARSCQYDNRSSGPPEGKEFPDELIKHQLYTKDFAQFN
jgi:hypothetical protein